MYKYLIVGKSGSGKPLLYRLKKYGFRPSRQHQTFKPRYEGEQGHIFVTKMNTALNGMQKLFIMVTTMELSEQLNNCDLYVVEPSGAYFEEIYDDIKIQSHILKPQILSKTTNENGDKEKIKQRLKIDKTLFAGMTAKADIVISNEHSIDECADKINEFIKNCEGGS